MDSVVLDDGVAQGIIDDIRQFEKSEDWYKKKGIPYRRGYLLHGPPGTGKTSLTQAIAGALGYNICYVNLSGEHMDDDSLNRLLNNSPGKALILLEDIDAIFESREKVEKIQIQRGGPRRVSFSGLLNALDGIRSQEGKILFMTTNHKDRLDPALLRPGRSDVHVLLNNASSKQVTNFFKVFFPNQENMADKFAEKIPEYKVSVARL